MNLSVEQKIFEFSAPIKEPTWSQKVPRWYQLDGPALALTDLFVEKARTMDFLILASPLASNLTDWDFVQSGKIHAQKFVHTLPNIRASMALQATGHVCDFICVQKGSDTRASAFLEFSLANQYKSQPALAVVDLIEIDEVPQKRQVYRTTLISTDPQGPWKCHPIEEKRDFSFEDIWNKNLFLRETHFQMGPWQWEKKN